ncbi:MAG: hypothetical protein HRU35_00700 [Rickettsiaceae bacterium]|nr:hypothetical protein [Rickettsiaceae bacterium]
MILHLILFIAIVTVCFGLIFATHIYEYFFPNKSIDPEISEECEEALFSEPEPKTIDHLPIDDK